MVVHLSLQFERKFQPPDFERRFIKIKQALNDEGIIIGESLDFAAAIAITAEQNLTRLIIKIGANKFRSPRRCFQIRGVIQYLGGARKSRNHQTIPSRDNFVVEMRTRTFIADRK